MELVIKIAVACVLLFPWSLIGLSIVAAVLRRRTMPEIPPPKHEPILLDSAQIAKALRETRQ
jgi:hypothetical protein